MYLRSGVNTRVRPNGPTEGQYCSALTLSRSFSRVNIMTRYTFCSHTILQKSSKVLGSGATGERRIRGEGGSGCWSCTTTVVQITLAGDIGISWSLYIICIDIVS